MTPKQLEKIKRMVARQKSSFSEIYGAATELIKYVEKLQEENKSLERNQESLERNQDRLISIGRRYYKYLDRAVRFLERYGERDALDLRLFIELFGQFFKEKDWEILGQEGFQKEEPGPVCAAYGAPFPNEDARHYGPLLFNVILSEVGPNLVKVLKETRVLMGLGLKEVQSFVKGAPALLREEVEEGEAEEVQKRLEAVGAVVEVVPVPF